MHFAEYMKMIGMYQKAF
jgi:hypothetical protein